jgi:hypothetical protein
MRELTELAKTGLGDWVKVSEKLEVSVDDNRGSIPCPWSHGVRCSKMITTVRRFDTKVSLRWSELNIHMIEAHGFFEGKGTAFRLEPELLIKVIF